MSAMPIPQVLVFQEFNLLPAALTSALRPFIFGPEYLLHRYAVATEKSVATAYNPAVDVPVTWASLGQADTSTVDQDYTAVTLESAELQYFNQAAVGVIVSGTKNRVRLSGYSLVGLPGIARSGGFYDRDVKVGDRVTLSASVSSVRYTVEANITGLIPEIVNPNGVVGSATADTSNQATVSASTPGSYTSTGTTTAITAASGGTYAGVPSGFVTETYTIAVQQGSTGGDLRTAILNITSSSGTDNVLGYAPAANFGSSFPVGTRGLTATLTKNSAADILVGNVFTITVRSVYTAPTIASGGTYSGPQDTTYVITCIVGGAMDGSTAAFQVRTNNGIDTGGTLYFATTVATVIGNLGATFTITGTSCRKGDRFLVPCTAQTTGAIKTVVFDQSLPSQLTSGSPSLDVSFAILKASVVLPPGLTGNTNATNWTQDDTGVVLQSGAQLYDPSYRGGLYGLPLTAGNAFITWRELLISHADTIYEISDTSDAAALFISQIDPDNPLVYAVNKTLINSNGTDIRIMAVASDDLDGYNAVLSKAEARSDLYGLVPLTFDTETQQAVAGHVASMSSPENAMWRICFLCPQTTNPANIVTTLSDGTSDVLTTVTLNGSLYDVELTAGAIAGEATFSAVNIGDTLRINYDVDVYGNPIYQEIPIASVDSTTMVSVASAPSPLPSSGLGVKIEIVRTLNSQGLSEQIGINSGVFASSRVYAVYPDKIQSGGVTVNGYHLCAAIAGLVSGVAPHQGLTNLTITGFDNANQTTQLFTRSQLDDMAGDGVWIVTADLQSGAVYTRQQLSTDNTDLNTQELSVVKNVDSISYVFQQNLAKYIGRSNVTPALIDMLTTDILAVISYLKTNGYTQTLGGQLIDATIASIAQHPTLKDRVVAVLNLTIPYPLNFLEVHLVI